MATVAFQMTSTPLTGTKTFTSTDQDMSDLLTWASVAYADLIQKMFNPGYPSAPPITPTNGQIGQALAQGTMNGWMQAEQKYKHDQGLAGVAVPPPMGWQ